MVIGWESCHSPEWSTVYSGYMMGIPSVNGEKTSSSEPVCVDSSPDAFQKMGQSGDGPRLSLFGTGYGFWYHEKPISCAVCAR